MQAAGLPDWVASDDADLVRRAVALSQDRQALLALKQGLREPTKVVNGFGLLHACQPPALSEPVRRDAQDNFGLRPSRTELSTQVLPCTTIRAVLNHIHGATMPYE